MVILVFLQSYAKKWGKRQELSYAKKWRKGQKLSDAKKKGKKAEIHGGCRDCRYDCSAL